MRSQPLIFNVNTSLLVSKSAKQPNVVATYKHNIETTSNFNVETTLHLIVETTSDSNVKNVIFHIWNNPTSLQHINITLKQRHFQRWNVRFQRWFILTKSNVSTLKLDVVSFCICLLGNYQNSPEKSLLKEYNTCHCNFYCIFNYGNCPR